MGQLVQLQERADEFKELNTELIFVFREEKEGVDGLKKIKEKSRTDFTLTLDLDKKSSKAYSPGNMTFRNYVIDKDGVLRADLDGTLRTRATGDQLIEELKKLQE